MLAAASHLQLRGNCAGLHDPGPSQLKGRLLGLVRAVYFGSQRLKSFMGAYTYLSKAG